MKLYNTLTQKMEEFVPVTPGEVKIYACGPTVYNYFHIGNSRVFVLFDTFRNYLKYRGYKVTFVQNITDIDDKIINKANLENTLWSDISKKYTDAYLEDIAKLNIDPPDISPRATQEIPRMLEIIKTLVDKGAAYVSKNGVYFSVEKFTPYGELSHQDMEQLVEGARVEVDDEKKNGLDFALWKFSKPGEPSWESPWGEGRPGWHIECSAMSSKYLSDTFDIHGGGADLIFPHHENERAQSEAANGVKFVNYWMHVGYMNIDGIKMSKSKGNFVFVRDILKDYPAEVIRMFILSAQYRGPIDFSRDNIEAVKTGYKEIYYTLQRLSQIKGEKPSSKSPYIEAFKAALDEDFNTAKASALLYDAVNDAKNLILGKKLEKYSGDNLSDLKVLESDIREMAGVLKLLPVIPAPEASALELVEKIAALRQAKEYEKADALKKEAAAQGLLLEFTKCGTFIIKELK
ncbi:MAG: cysteine--tRNA ligase [Candidatus Goldiibacteriota bacterium]|jgi:cysteinyl-tRNA synthetase